ncbi:MAG: GTP cyclohydrolase I FolE [Actinomycetota bacterium]|nr:GTP cyclohydrolase I FolE [Actinomycetota bacterium]
MNEKTRISPNADPLADIDPSQRQPFDQAKIENAIKDILIAIGEDPDRDGLQDTPARVARACQEMFAGLYERPDEVLATTFDLNHNELVIVKNIDIFSVCEHHLLPFVGKASVGYIPNNSGQITGLSKLARLIDVYAKRPQVQERLTSQVADALMRILKPQGVIVVIECEHFCMTMRGVSKPGAKTITSVVRGNLEDPALRHEALTLISHNS